MADSGSHLIGAVVRLYHEPVDLNHPPDGTAFVLDDHHLLTAAHLVEGRAADEIAIDGLPGADLRHPAVAYCHESHDVALLRLPLPLSAAPTFPLASPEDENPADEEEVVVHGYNARREIESKVCHLSGQDHSGAPHRVLHPYTGRGMSGGPVLHEGRLIGVCNARDTDRNRAYCVPLAGFREFLIHNGVETSITLDDEPTVSTSRAASLFTAREAELALLSDALLPNQGEAAPVVVTSVQGMPGVGKSYLVDRFFEVNRARLGGYERIVLDPEAEPSARIELARLADELGIEGQGWRATVGLLRRHLCARRVLVHIENVDSAASATVAQELAGQLAGVLLCATGRLESLAFGGRARQIRLLPFGLDDGLRQLRQELEALGGTEPDPTDAPKLVRALGGLPLAIHLAAGHMHALGTGADAYLELLRAAGLRLEPYDPTDVSRESERLRRVLSTSFDLSLRQLAADLRDDNCFAGFLDLGFAPAAGFGLHLGAAVSGLDGSGFQLLFLRARRLSLLLPAAGRKRWRIHPLLAEYLRNQRSDSNARRRLHCWFWDHLADREDHDDRRRCWDRLDGETEGLFEWLPRLGDDKLPTLERHVREYAATRGPFHAWTAFLQRCLDRVEGPAERSDLLWTLAQVAQRSGDLDGSLHAAEEKLRIDRERGEEREAALAQGQIADILYARGELDEALRIRTEEELPVYERLGDVRSLLVARANLALFYLQRDREGDRQPAHNLLCLALESALAMRIPEAPQILAILVANKMRCDVLPEELWRQLEEGSPQGERDERP